MSRTVFSHWRRLAVVPTTALVLSVAAPASAAPTVQTQRPTQADRTRAVDSALAADSLFDSIPPPSLRRIGAPVLLGADTLYMIYESLGPYTASERAAAVTQRLDSISAHLAVEGDTAVATLEVSQLSTDVVLDGLVVATITDDDALAVGQTRDSLAVAVADSLAAAAGRRIRTGLGEFATGVLKTLLATALLVLVLMALRWIFARAHALLEPERSQWIRTIRIQRLELISAERLQQTLSFVVRVLRVVLTAGVLYFFIPLVLSFFPLTSGLAEELVQLVLDPLRDTWRAVTTYIVEDLFSILVILGVMYYAFKLIHLVFDGIRTKRIRISGFFTDWAEPTYQIVRFLGLVLAVILIWPHLPMSESPGFQGVAAFLGLLVTFGSASAISNVVGGVVLIYMRAFQIGDRVQIADTVGDVIEKGMLVTRIRTPKNVNVTIPNSMVLSNHLINYSRAALHEGVVLHTTITLGYDVPWAQVHEVLAGAAGATDGIMEEPEPFVLQKSLDDFYVAYELNAYTREPSRAERIYSALHQNIQDACNAAGIEILSPHFRGLRDGNPLQVPPDAVPPGYRTGSFKVSRIDGGES